MKNSRSMRFGILLLAAITAHAYAEHPVIDMHVHTKNVVQAGPEHAENLATMYAYEAEADENNVVLFAASGAQDFVESWSRYFGDRMLGGATFPCVNGVTNFESEHDGRRPCFSSGGAFPDPDWLKMQYASGRLKIMGELGMQYAGISFNDARMTPYYQMAEELGVPVAFHTSGGPPRTAARCCPGFRLSIGNPEQLEEVLVQFPEMHVQVMHGNVLTYPGLLRMLQQYPNVYVDLTPFSSILPKEGFHQMLRSYRMHGLLDRIMFATDDFPVAETIAAFQSADFLTEEELGGILCGNAEHFLELEGICKSL